MPAPQHPDREELAISALHLWSDVCELFCPFDDPVHSIECVLAAKIYYSLRNPVSQESLSA